MKRILGRLGGVVFAAAVVSIPFAPDIGSAQSVDPDHGWQVWASVSDPVDLTAALDGSLFVGRDLSDSGGVADANTQIHHVSAAQVVSTYGAGIDDPDTVLYDKSGVFGSAGSVIVGGSLANGSNPADAQFTEVDVLQNNTVIYGPSSSILDPSGMDFESSGDLVFTDFDRQEVYRLSSGVLLLVVNESVGLLDIVVHPDSGNLYVSHASGIVRVYSSAGAVVTASLTTGRALALDPFTSPPDLYTVDNATGDLLRIDSLGVQTTIGTGFTDVFGMDFAPNGRLYLTEFSKDRVLEISLPRPAVAVPSLSSAARSGIVIGWAVSTAFALARRRGVSRGATMLNRTRDDHFPRQGR